MGRRSRRQAKPAEAPGAPSEDYADPEGNVLTLRGSLTVGSRRAYAEALAGSPLSRRGRGGSAPSSCCSSAWPSAG